MINIFDSMIINLSTNKGDIRMRRIINLLTALIITTILLTGTSGFCSEGDTQGGFISGMIYEADGKTPIHGARVSAIKLDGDCAGFTTTNADGEYIIQNLSVGIYEVKVSLLGFASSTKSNISVAENGITSNVNFILIKGGILISGRITESNGFTAIKYATVKAQFPSDIYISSAESQSDRFGDYSCFIDDKYIEIDEPAIFIVVEAVGYGKSIKDISMANIETGVNIDNFNFALDEGGSVSGLITKIDGITPIPDLDVLVQHQSTRLVVDSQRTNSQGQYSFEFLMPGSYNIVTISSIYGSQISEPFQVMTNQNVVTNLSLIENGLINGKITEDDGVTPIKEASIGAVIQNGTEGSFALSEENGDFIIRELLPERYTVVVSKEGYLTTIQDNVVLLPGESIDLSISLQRDN
jgi:hypothetical protein